MTTSAKDPVARLAQVGRSSVASEFDAEHEAEVASTRPPAVAEHARLRERASAIAKAAAAAALPAERAVLAAIRKVEEETARLQEVRARTDAEIAAAEADVNHAARVLSAPESLPRAVLELEAELPNLGDLMGRRDGLPTVWPHEAREAWHAELVSAGAALAALRLQVGTGEEVAAVRKLLDALQPSVFAERHGELCRREEVAPARWSPF